jgi:hypothetical protein
MAAHPKPARVIDNDQVRAAAFDKFGADAGAGSRRYERPPSFEGGSQSFDDLLAAVGITLSGPWIWHNSISKAGHNGGLPWQLQS